MLLEAINMSKRDLRAIVCRHFSRVCEYNEMMEKHKEVINNCNKLNRVKFIAKYKKIILSSISYEERINKECEERRIDRRYRMNERRLKSYNR